MVTSHYCQNVTNSVNIEITRTCTLFGKTCTITQGADSTSCSYTSCSYTGLASVPSGVGCSAGSKTISVTGYRHYVCKWSDGTQASSTKHNDCSTSCTKTYTSNCSSTSDKTISGTCNGVAYSFTQAGDPCNGFSITGTNILPSGGVCYKSYTITASATNGTPSISVSPTPYSVSGNTYTFKRPQDADFTFVATASLSGCDSKTFSGTIEKLSEPTSWTHTGYMTGFFTDTSHGIVEGDETTIWKKATITVEVAPPGSNAKASKCEYSYTKYLGNQSTVLGLYASKIGTLTVKYTVSSQGVASVPQYTYVTLGSNGKGSCDIEISQKYNDEGPNRNIVLSYEISYPTSFTSDSYPGVAFNVKNMEAGTTDGKLEGSITWTTTGGGGSGSGGGGGSTTPTLCNCFIALMNLDETYSLSVNTSSSECSTIKRLSYKYYPTSTSTQVGTLSRLSVTKPMPKATVTSVKDPICTSVEEFF